MKIYSEFDDDVEDSLEVIPLVLSEQDVRELSDEVLRLIADCSTKVVVDVLKRDYLSNTKADPAVQAKIRKAYSYQLGRDAYLDSEEVANNVDMLRDVNYSTIVAEMPVHQLQGCKDAITQILNSEYAVAYTPPVSTGQRKSLEVKLSEISGNADMVEALCIRKTLQRIHSNKDLFQDARSAGYTGTPVKNVLRNRERYEIISRGIDFLLEKKSKGLDPSSWRHL